MKKRMNSSKWLNREIFIGSAIFATAAPAQESRNWQMIFPSKSNSLTTVVFRKSSTIVGKNVEEHRALFYKNK